MCIKEKLLRRARRLQKEHRMGGESMVGERERRKNACKMKKWRKNRSTPNGQGDWKGKKKKTRGSGLSGWGGRASCMCLILLASKATRGERVIDPLTKGRGQPRKMGFVCKVTEKKRDQGKRQGKEKIFMQVLLSIQGAEKKTYGTSVPDLTKGQDRQFRMLEGQGPKGRGEESLYLAW